MGDSRENLRLGARTAIGRQRGKRSQAQPAGIAVAWVLLDTDALIDFFKEVSSAVEIIEELYRQGDTLCTCAVIVAELYSGFRPVERERGEQLLEAMLFFPATRGAARQAGLWRYEFARRGKQLATTDCLIAAIAHEHQATLLTGNVDDYPMPDVRIISLPRPPRGSG